MGTLFTQHFAVRTTPKKVFRKNFVAGAAFPLLALFVAASTRYNKSSLMISQFLGAFLGTIVGAAFCTAFGLLLAGKLPTLAICFLVLHYGSIIAHCIYTKIKERKNGDEEETIYLYTMPGK